MEERSECGGGLKCQVDDLSKDLNTYTRRETQVQKGEISTGWGVEVGFQSSVTQPLGKGLGRTRLNLQEETFKGDTVVNRDS